MTPLDVLSTIRQAGGMVVVLDGDLQVIAPAGTVSVEAAAVLWQHKAALVAILPQEEREAIGWVEALPEAEAAVVVGTAIKEWDEIVGSTVEPIVNSTPEPVVIRAEITGDEIRLHCPTPEIAVLVEAGRSRIEWILAEIDGSLDQEQEVVSIPCSFCGSLTAWWDVRGAIHCLDCDPPIRSERLREQAARLRRLNPVSTKL